MLVNEWVETLWTVLNVRPKTLQNYKHQYGRYLKDVMGSYELDLVKPVELQQCLLALPPQTSRHCLMLIKTFYREARASLSSSVKDIYDFSLKFSLARTFTLKYCKQEN